MSETRNSEKGFSIIEVMLGIMVFMVGMLGVAMLHISVVQGNTFTGDMFEATSLASSQLEYLLALPYDDDLLDDTDGNGVPQDWGFGTVVGDTTGDGEADFGLDDDLANSDQPTAAPSGQGTHNKFFMYWNVSEDSLINQTKTVKVFVRWDVKGDTRLINLQGVIPSY
jgi:Tfp pilus assembly protein PilV